MMASLALGTAQFGMAYGIANTTGRPDPQAVADILAVAHSSGIDLLDTAIAYGEAEAILGQAGLAGWKVVTKLPPVPEDEPDVSGWMEAQVTASLTRLGIAHLHGLLLHAPAQMHGSRAATIARSLERIADRGFTGRVGVSIQNPDHDLPAVLAHMAPGLIQAPFNLLDDALITQGWAGKLRAMGCEIHTRSTFLQGLLLMDPSMRPAWCDRWSAHWQVWQAWLDRTGLRASDACLRHTLSQPAIDRCIIGVDSDKHLRDLLAAGEAPLPDLPRWPGVADPDLITPSRWPAQ